MADQPDRDQKTEEATPRRRQEAREKGQVALSAELIAGITLLTWVGAFLMMGPSTARGVATSLSRLIQGVGTVGVDSWDLAGASVIVQGVGYDTLGILAALVLPLFVMGIFVAYAQVGFQITPKALSMDLARINPIKGVGRLFSARSAMRTGMALAKILAIVAVMLSVAWFQMDRIEALAANDLGPSLAGTGSIILRCALGGIAAILALALVDLVFQRFQHDRDLRMSKQELKEESKQTEGDPHLKARIRSVQREMASQRMMQDVPKATVVVTNPTHYAVALKYDRDAGSMAPKVVAKGVDLIAQNIKRVAQEHDVLCYEDVPLARALYAQCEIGDDVPVELYEAVASVLAYVYRVQGIEAHV